MRRNALSVSCLLSACLLLSGCSGTTVFWGDTLGFAWNPNRPIGDSENMRRVRGLPADVPVLKPEEGNVWPGPAAPPPTLQDLEKQQNDLGGAQPNPAPGPFMPDHRQPTPGGLAAPLAPETGPPAVPPRSSVPSAGPQGPIYQTPSGPAVGTRGQGSINTINPPGNAGSIVVPNGNGTSTVISPDGSISTVPTPK